MVVLPTAGGAAGADGDADVGFGGASIAFGDEVEVGGVGGRDGLGAVDVDLADAIDGDDGGVGGAPVEDDGSAEVNGGGVGGEGGGGGCGWRRVVDGAQGVGIDAAGFFMAAGGEG